LHDWNRADASTVRQAAVEHAEGGVFLLADSPTNPIPVPEGAEACKQLVSLLRTMYEYAVYDIGHGVQTPLAQQAVKLADRVVLVVRLDVPGLRLTRGLMNRLTDMGLAPSKLVLVANRYGQRKQIGWRKVEEALGTSVHVWLPDEPGIVNQAMNLGLPLTQAAGWSKFGRRLNDLALAAASRK
jgi:Flp pilus assembly CpaE family ATPase